MKTLIVAVLISLAAIAGCSKSRSAAVQDYLAEQQMLDQIDAKISEVEGYQKENAQITIGLGDNENPRPDLGDRIAKTLDELYKERDEQSVRTSRAKDAIPR